MTPPYEFGDAHPIVKVCFNRDGWEWFRDLVNAELPATDGFVEDVERAHHWLAPLDTEDE